MSSIANLRTNIAALNANIDTFEKLSKSVVAKDETRIDRSLNASGDDVSINTLVDRSKLIGEEAVFVADCGAVFATMENITTLATHIRNCSNSISTLNGYLRSDDITSFSSVPGHISFPGRNISLANVLSQWEAQSGSALDTLKSAILRPSKQAIQRIGKSVAAFRESAGKIEKRAAEIVQKYQQVEKLRDQIEEIANAAPSLKEEIERTRDDTHDLSVSASGDRDTISELKGSIEELLEQSLEDRKKLEKELTSATEASGGISNLVARLESGLERDEELFQRANLNEIRIAELAKQAETMMSGATVAGLASVYQGRMNSINGELQWANWGVKFALFLLAMSALPLAYFIVAPIFGVDAANVGGSTLSEQKQTNVWDYLGEAVGRFSLLVPAALFAAFQTKRYNSLFALREHYAHKYSMAVSVEGFKKQAPEYDSAIAASVFERLTVAPRIDKERPKEGSELVSIPSIESVVKDLRSLMPSPGKD